MHSNLIHIHIHIHIHTIVLLPFHRLTQTLHRCTQMSCYLSLDNMHSSLTHSGIHTLSCYLSIDYIHSNLTHIHTNHGLATFPPLPPFPPAETRAQSQEAAHAMKKSVEGKRKECEYMCMYICMGDSRCVLARYGLFVCT